MSNWREMVLDRAITKARAAGFKDMDFEGWEQIPADDRKQVIRTIITNNGVAGIVFRRSFARALWGKGEAPSPNTEQDLFTSDDYLRYNGFAFIWHLQQMAVAHYGDPDQDAWLQYIREHMP